MTVNLTVILLNTNFQGNTTSKKVFINFIKNCLVLSFINGTYANKCSGFLLDTFEVCLAWVSVSFFTKVSKSLTSSVII